MKSAVGLFENLVKIATGVYLILVCVGYVQLTYYYDAYGINISNYIGASEIFLYSFGKIILKIIILIIPMLIVSLLLEDLQDYYRRKVSIVVWATRTAFARLFFLFFILVLITSLLCKEYYFKKSISSRYINIPFLISGYTLLLSTLSLFLFKKKYDIKKDSKGQLDPILNVSFAALFITQIVMTHPKSTLNIDIISKKEQINVLLKGNQSLISSDKFHYLGKTDKFIFFFNDSLNASKVYPVDEVKEITVMHSE